MEIGTWVLILCEIKLSLMWLYCIMHRGTIPVYNCCPGLIINGLSVTLKVSWLDNKLCSQLVIMLFVCFLFLFLPVIGFIKNCLMFR